ncbi:MAG TPA: hypothetical protein DCG57_01980 [Candidatus Riflebacteria bacterium]|nr:hypothetical protein [Candidatus Riflebacteria bacterium]
MKRNYSKVLSIVLICSFVLSSFTQVFAYGNDCSVNRIYNDLNNAYNIVNSGRLYTDIQNARPYISHAQKLLNRMPCSSHNTRKIDRVMDKAKTEILWNNKHDALNQIGCAMRMVENLSGSNSNSQGGHYNGSSNSSNSGTGAAMIAAPVAIGIGAALVGLFSHFNWGYTRTRVSPPRLPATIVPVR